MTRNEILYTLEDDAELDARRILDALQFEGYVLLPKAGEVHPRVQARLWRQSRTPEQVQEIVEALRDAGAPYIASLFEGPAPAPGPHVTNQIPGMSWHQWGHALRVKPLVNWAPGSEAALTYEKLAWEAQQLGAYTLRAFGEPGTIVFATGSPLDHYASLADLDDALRRRWRNR